MTGKLVNTGLSDEKEVAKKSIAGHDPSARGNKRSEQKTGAQSLPLPDS